MSYLVEQPPHCDLLRLSLRPGDLSASQTDATSWSWAREATPTTQQGVFFSGVEEDIHPLAGWLAWGPGRLALALLLEKWASDPVEEDDAQ